MLSSEWPAFETRIAARRGSLFYELENLHPDERTTQRILGQCQAFSAILRMKKIVIREMETKRKKERVRDEEAQQRDAEISARENFINAIAPMPDEPDIT